jgi:hypothetical protein
MRLASAQRCLVAYKSPALRSVYAFTRRCRRLLLRETRKKGTKDAQPRVGSTPINEIPEKGSPFWGIGSFSPFSPGEPEYFMEWMSDLLSLYLGMSERTASPDHVCARNLQRCRRMCIVEFRMVMIASRYRWTRIPPLRRTVQGILVC